LLFFQLKTLSTTVSRLEKSLSQSGTGDLLSLPDDVTKMQGTMASFGSQLRDVTSQLTSVHNLTSALVARMDAAERRVDEVARNATTLGSAATVDGESVAAMNATLQWAVEDLHAHHVSS
jgi:hypothetical protein